MILRVQNFLMIALFALLSLFWAQSFVSPNPISGGYQFFEEAASGDFTHNPLNALDKFAPSPKTAPDYANAPNSGPRITIRDHYNHHRDMTNDLKSQLEEQGYRVSEREISFGSSCGVGRCCPDIVYETPDGKLGIIEVKTGNADLTIRQSEIYPQIRDGSSIPRGQVADDFGLDPGIPLRDQGYPNGIPIEIRTFPGAGQ